MKKISFGILAFAFAALPLGALAQQNGDGDGNHYGNQGRSAANCANGQSRSCIAGQITRIDGVNVYISSGNRSVRVNDQSLWDNGRQDRQLVSGQNVMFSGSFDNDGTFVASSLGSNNGNGYGNQQSYNNNQSNNSNGSRSNYGCGSGSNQSCLSGQITRIDGKNVYVNSSNGGVRVYDQPLWDDNRQDMRLVNGQNVTFGGYYTENNVFVATRIVDNGRRNY